MVGVFGVKKLSLYFLITARSEDSEDFEGSEDSDWINYS